MASIVVRGLDDALKQQLVDMAARNGRSMEAEVRRIIAEAVQRPHIGLALMYAAQEAGGVDHLHVPERTDSARAATF